MGIPLRSVLTTTAAFLAGACLLHAEGGTWSGQLGMAMPSGGSKQWVGNAPGPSLDVMESYSLDQEDEIRMRFGYYAFKGSSSTPQVLSIPGGTAATCPATTTNELYGFTYGAEFLRSLPARFYVLAGLGVTYLSATRTGSFDLTPAGGSLTRSDYSANNFVPYYCAGLGFRFSRSLALEARWQTSAMKQQSRALNLDSLGYTAAGRVYFDKLTVGAVSVGLNLRF